MTFKLLFTLFFTFSAIQLAFSQQCLSIETNSGEININSLSEAKFQAKGNDESTYNVKICSAFTDIPSQCHFTKSFASYETTDTGSCRGIGAFDQTTAVTLLNPSNPEKGVSIMYNGGDPLGTTGTATQVDLLCDHSDSLSFECNNPDCRDMRGSLIVYHFVLKTSAACPYSGRGFLWPVGLLGIFLILSIFGFIIYWPIGIVVNKFIRKKEGIEIIPNVAFWKDLPFLVKDGILFLFKDLIYEKVIAVIIEKIKSRRGGYEAA